MGIREEDKWKKEYKERRSGKGGKLKEELNEGGGKEDENEAGATGIKLPLFCVICASEDQRLKGIHLNQIHTLCNRI
jgi:hypothetical protein